jgi:phospholipid-binding lipoprotein MlaA
VRPTTAPARPAPRRGARAAAALLALALLAGCATTAPPPGTAVAAPHPADPWESFNRRMFAFNDAVDEAVLKPVATAYRDTVPQWVRTGVDNVLGNLRDVWSTANQFLQGKVQFGFEMGMRVLTNSFFGLGGLLDPATEMGLTRRSEDFGQTLAVWGVGNGPYVVLPLLGPSTLRDTAALPLDRRASPGEVASTESGRYAITALEVVHARAGLLSATALIGEVALDRYVLIRDGYLARRRDAIFDGAPPMETFDDPGVSDPMAEPAEAPAPPARP